MQGSTVDSKSQIAIASEQEAEHDTSWTSRLSDDRYIYLLDFR